MRERSTTKQKPLVHQVAPDGIYTLCGNLVSNVTLNNRHGMAVTCEWCLSTEVTDDRRSSAVEEPQTSY